MKTTIKTIIALAAFACIAFSYAHYAPPPRGHWHHRHHTSFWGHAGHNFWPGFMGGLAGSILWRPLPPPPPPRPAVVVTPQPVVVAQPQPVIVQPVQPQVIVQPAPAPLQSTVIVR